MSDEEIDRLIAEIDQMAQRVGCRFEPDPDKLMAFRCSQSEERAMRKHYREQARLISDMQTQVGCVDAILGG